MTIGYKVSTAEQYKLPSLIHTIFSKQRLFIDRLPLDILYARLDFVRVGDQFSVREVELIEPIFSFNLVPEGIERLVSATTIKLGNHP